MSLSLLCSRRSLHQATLSSLLMSWDVVLQPMTGLVWLGQYHSKFCAVLLASIGHCLQAILHSLIVTMPFACQHMYLFSVSGVVGLSFRLQR